MAENDTTTTTSTEAETTTTTSTQPETTTDTSTNDTVTETSTVTAGASVTTTGLDDNLASDVKSPTTNDTTQTDEQRLDEAKATALHNHAVEHAEDPVTSSSDPTVV